MDLPEALLQWLHSPWEVIPCEPVACLQPFSNFWLLLVLTVGPDESGKGSCFLLLEAALTKVHTCLGL